MTPLVPPSPRRTRRAGLPHRAPQSASGASAASNRRMESCRVRQVEPRAAHQVAPVQPVPLAALSQRPNPLPLYFLAYPFQLPAAVVERKVLVESAEHRRQVRLLLACAPMAVSFEPCVCAIQKRPAALMTGNADHRKPPFPIDAAHMLEAEELKGLLPIHSTRPSPVHLAPRGALPCQSRTVHRYQDPVCKIPVSQTTVLLTNRTPNPPFAAVRLRCRLGPDSLCRQQAARASHPFGRSGSFSRPMGFRSPRSVIRPQGEGVGPRKAIIALALKLLVVAWRMLQIGEVYRATRTTTVTHKHRQTQSTIWIGMAPMQDARDLAHATHRLRARAKRLEGLKIRWRTLVSS